MLLDGRCVIGEWLWQDGLHHYSSIVLRFKHVLDEIGGRGIISMISLSGSRRSSSKRLPIGDTSLWCRDCFNRIQNAGRPDTSSIAYDQIYERVNLRKRFPTLRVNHRLEYGEYDNPANGEQSRSFPWFLERIPWEAIIPILLVIASVTVLPWLEKIDFWREKVIRPLFQHH